MRLARRCSASREHRTNLSSIHIVSNVHLHVRNTVCDFDRRSFLRTVDTTRARARPNTRVHADDLFFLSFFCFSFLALLDGKDDQRRCTVRRECRIGKIYVRVKFRREGMIKTRFLGAGARSRPSTERYVFKCLRFARTNQRLVSRVATTTIVGHRRAFERDAKNISSVFSSLRDCIVISLFPVLLLRRYFSVTLS